MHTPNSIMRRWGVLIIVLFTFTSTACGDATDSNNGDANNGGSDNNGTSDQMLEVEGTWVTNYGSVFEIDSATWGSQDVVEFENEANLAITQVPDDAEMSAGTYSRLVWTEPSDGSWWYCTVDFGLDTEQAALDSEETADDSNPSEDGCGGFPWTKMSVPIEVRGTYMNQFDMSETITGTTWDFGIEMTIVDWDNEQNWAVTQNPDDAETAPSAFSKLVWTEPDADGVFYYCTVDFGLETADDARNTEKTADDTNPEEEGCGDFAWTKMTPEDG